MRYVLYMIYDFISSQSRWMGVVIRIPTQCFRFKIYYFKWQNINISVLG